MGNIHNHSSVVGDDLDYLRVRFVLLFEFEALGMGCRDSTYILILYRKLVNFSTYYYQRTSTSTTIMLLLYTNFFLSLAFGGGDMVAVLARYPHVSNDTKSIDRF